MINEITLIGNLGRDAEQTTTQSGRTVTRFSVATTENRQVNGAWESTTEWHKCSIWGAEYLAAKLKKGVRVYVKGKLQSYEYQNQRRWEILAQQVKVLSGDESYQSPQELLPPDSPTSGWG